MRKFCGKCDKSVSKSHKCSSKNSNKPVVKHYNNTDAGKRMRLDILERDLLRCQECWHVHRIETLNSPEAPLEMHHIKPQGIKRFEHLKDDPNNLVMLCHDCHETYRHDTKYELRFEFNPAPLNQEGPAI